MSEKRGIWAGRWSYPEGWLIVLGLLLISYTWQGLMGSILPGTFAHPMSTILLIALTIVSVCIGVVSKKATNAPAFVRFMVSPEATITSLSLLFGLLMVMGFSTQVDPRMANGIGGLFHSAGWSAMIHSYPFNTAYLYLLVVLGSVTTRRLITFKPKLRDIGFVLNHLGLYAFLCFAMISGSSMQRYTMALTQDDVEWRAYNQSTQAYEELPIALELKYFTLEEYPPKLMLLDGEAGSLLPIGAPDMIDVESIPTTGQLMEWEVTVDELLPLGAPLVRDSTIVFSQFASTGGAPAAKITAKRGDKVVEGWVSCGSYLFPHRAVSLGDELSIVMPYPDVRQYYSTLDYYLMEGEQGSKQISVNNPLRVGDWYVYQLNFDEEKRRWATTTEVELVYDPWITYVLVSIWVLFSGAAFLLLGPSSASINQKRKGE